jgi:hypothetical protein
MICMAQRLPILEPRIKQALALFGNDLGFDFAGVSFRKTYGEEVFY